MFALRASDASFGRDVGFARDVCLRARWANIASRLRAAKIHHGERSELHHAARHNHEKTAA